MRLKSPKKKAIGGFSLVELAFTGALAVTVIGAAVMVFHMAGVRQKRQSTIGIVPLQSVLMANYFTNTSSSSINTYHAPNTGRWLQATRLRDLFWQDVEMATAVFCLGRTSMNTIRPITLTVPSGTDVSTIDTPAKFYNLLVANYSSATSVFVSARGTPFNDSGSTTDRVARNASIFIIEPTGDTDGDLNYDNEYNTMRVRAIWEVDFNYFSGSGNTAKGTYAVVHRHYGVDFVHGQYYDIFFEDATASDHSDSNKNIFGPVFVHFERSARAFTGPTADPKVELFKKAGNHPFYFIWWPDPSQPRLNSGVMPASPFASDDVRRYYYRHNAQTSLFMVAPQFPNLR